MPYDWDEISKNWLLGVQINYPREQCVNAFNTVQRLLGSEWIESYATGARGYAIALSIIELGKILEVIANIPKADSIIDRIKTRDSFASAWSEAQFLSQLILRKFDVRINPTIGVASSMKQPDFAAISNGNAVYIEVSRPMESDWQRRITKEFKRVDKIILDITPKGTRVEAYLYRDPNMEDWNTIINCIKQMISNSAPESKINGLVQLFVSPVETERLSTFLNGMLEKRPVVAMAEMRMEDGISKCLAFNIPVFSDNRAQQTMKREAKQFSKAFSNLMVLDLSLVPGGIRDWESLVSRKLQPNLHPRIGGFIVPRQDGVHEGAVTGFCGPVLGAKCTPQIRDAFVLLD